MIHDMVTSSPATKLVPSMNETSLIQALVAQFLKHDGYVETARAFQEEVQSENRALNIGQELFKDLDAKEDVDAVNRQRKPFPP